MRAIALRYVLAPACVLLAVLVHLSPAGSLFPYGGLFVLAVVGGAWFGGVGPGLLTAALSALTLPPLIAVSYPLLGGVLDLPRFIAFSAIGLAVGWWSLRRQQVEAALRESEKRHELAMNASKDGFWDWIPAIDKLYVSPRFLEICGFPPDTTFAGRAAMFERLSMPQEDRAALDRAVAEHFAGKTPRMEKEFRILVTGEMHWIHARGLATRNARGEVVRWNGAARDITEWKRAEEALRESEERYERAVNASDDGFWDWTSAGDTVYASPRLREICGFASDASFAGRSDLLSRIPFHPEERPRLLRGFTEHLAGKTARYKVEARFLRGGETRWVQLVAFAACDSSGAVVSWTGTARDITELKRAEEALRLAEQKRRHAQRLEAMGTLAGGIAHDFNNILGAILGYGEMALKDAPAGTRLRRDLETILTAGERGRVLVDRVLMFSHSGAGARRPIHVEKEVTEALDLLTAGLPAGISIEARLTAGRAAMLGEPTQVHQVMTNLVTNAIQAMPAGGTLAVTLRAERFDAERAATVGTVAAAVDYIVLEVADSGTGIAPAHLDHIFDPFFTTKEINVGNGLGLSLVHGIITDLEGAIDVASNHGSGSTFTVYLPRTGDVLNADSSPEHLPPRGSGQRVLVIDDEEPLLRLTAETLEGLGYQPMSFTSSTAAIEAFRADPEGFDAVITDERMPGMSGSALIREVRRIRKTIPILLVSGFVGATVTSRAYNDGADEVLKKPLSGRDLAAVLARVFRR